MINLKKTYVLLLILFSFILTGCQNNNEEKNEYTRNILQYSGESNQDNDKVETQRISYQEYMDKYGNVDKRYDDQNNVINYESGNEVNEEPINQEATNESANQESINQENNTKPKTPSNQLATYSTSLQSSSNSRVNNIKIVCERLNNFILKPGQTFSYNNELGPYGPSDGFKKAPILLSNGKKSKGYGGRRLPIK